jgi:hypothetical protein
MQRPTECHARLSPGCRALGMAWEHVSAERELRNLRDIFSRLPASTTQDTSSFLGWGEQRFCCAENFTYSHLGNYHKACAAQGRTLQLYPSISLRDPTKIELQRALCLVNSGDPIQGASYACSILDKLPEELHSLPIVFLSERIPKALPIAARESQSTKALHDYVVRNSPVTEVANSPRDLS